MRAKLSQLLSNFDATPSFFNYKLKSQLSKSPISIQSRLISLVGRQLNLWLPNPVQTLHFYTRLTLKVFRKSTPKATVSSCGYFFCFPRVFEMSHLIIAFHSQNFKVELLLAEYEQNGQIDLFSGSFFRIVCSKNGQLTCPNTKLLVLLVTADEDCRLIFSIWWINRADHQQDQHETEI